MRGKRFAVIAALFCSVVSLESAFEFLLPHQAVLRAQEAVGGEQNGLTGLGYSSKKRNVKFGVKQTEISPFSTFFGQGMRPANALP